MSFNALKQSSAADFEQIATAAFKSTPAGRNSEKEEDPRFWVPRRDKAGNAYHVIRFLPAPVDDGGHPWVEWSDYWFEGPTGKWYVERSLRSIGQPDPVWELNGELWKQGENSPGRAQYAKQKARTHYTANILVISDGVNPENNGKVFMWTFGKKIFSKVASAMRPEFPDQPKFNPFDLWTGADFRVKVKTADNFVNYDASDFAVPAPLLGGDDVALETVYKQVYSLKQEYKDPAGYKSYQELKTKLQDVCGLTPSGVKADVALEQTINQPFTPNTGIVQPSEVPGIPMGVVQPTTSSAPQPVEAAPTTGTDPMAIFKQLAQDAAKAAKTE